MIDKCLNLQSNGLLESNEISCRAVVVSRVDQSELLRIVVLQDVPLNMLSLEVDLDDALGLPNVFGHWIGESLWRKVEDKLQVGVHFAEEIDLGQDLVKNLAS